MSENIDDLLKDLKLSLRLDGNEDDPLLNMYLKSARTYIVSAVGESESFYQLDGVVDLFNTAIIAQASGYYTARTALSNMPLTPVNFTVNSIISQLRGKYAVFIEKDGVKNEN